jgi:ankyrin repeat protein
MSLSVTPSQPPPAHDHVKLETLDHTSDTVIHPQPDDYGVRSTSTRVVSITALPAGVSTSHSGSKFYFVLIYDFSMTMTGNSERTLSFSQAGNDAGLGIEFLDCALFQKKGNQKELRYKESKASSHGTRSVKITFEVVKTRRYYTVAVLLRIPTQTTALSVSLDCYIDNDNKLITGITSAIPTDESGKKEKTKGVFWAAMSGWLNTLKALLDDSSLGVNEKDSTGRSLLSYAADNGHNTVVTFLLEREASVCLGDSRKRTPLHWAASSGHDDVVNVLLNNNAPINEEDSSRRTPLHYAAGNGHEKVVETLLSNGAAWRAKDSNQRLALSQAAQSGHTSVVAQLLDCAKAPVGPGFFMIDDEDNNKETPTSLAAKHGHVETLRLLVKAGLSTAGAGAYSEYRFYEERYLLKAAECGLYLLLQVLLEYKISSEPKTEYTNPLCAAAKNGNLDIVDILLKHGANPDAVGNDVPVLCIAIREKKDLIVKALLAAGANVHVEDTDGTKPLTLAYNNGGEDNEIWSMIKEKIDEGPLSETAQKGDEEIDLLFNARIISFTSKNGSMEYHSKGVKVASLLNHSDLREELPGLAFRWIHLPANNVGHQVDLTITPMLTKSRCGGLR